MEGNTNQAIDKVLAKEESLYVFDEAEHEKMFKEKPWNKE